MKILLLVGSLLLAFLHITTALVLAIGFVLFVIPVIIIRHALGLHRTLPQEAGRSH
ncbi:hypothetical protein [Spirosoma rigui]|uniref:hypothetical protein n=1 Tax=Spirosoma rigui TaxID=564064 RepID=UPI0012D32E35|nr:hypothetical protein [Spirosoma rigui]